MSNNTTSNLSVSHAILNDYILDVSEIEGGHRLTITKGSVVKIVDIMDGKPIEKDVDAVHYSADTGKTAQQKAQARANIEAYKFDADVGIPYEDLEEDVQASLDLADTALQEHQSLAEYRKTADQAAVDNAQNTRLTNIETQEASWTAKYDKPVGGIPKSDLAAAVQESLGKADTSIQAADILTKQDKVDSDLQTVSKAVVGGINELHVTTMRKVTTAVDGNIATFDENGAVEDSGRKPSEFITSHQSLAEYRKSAAQDVIDAGKVDKVEGKGLSTNDYTTSEKTSLANIATLIPAPATPTNQLADKAYVVGAISGSAGTFHGTYSKIADLPTAGIKDNDYAFVTVTEATGNTVYQRYKVASGLWVFEYELNNPTFTAAQWGSINSTITYADKTKLDGIDISLYRKSAAQDTIDAGKADKVASAVNGNFASLDINGNLKDSGHKHSDYLTEHQSLAAYVKTVDQNAIDAVQNTNINSLITRLNTVEPEVVQHDARLDVIEGKEAGWDAKYTKPSTGIPKSDLNSTVQASLAKADTALQEHQSLAAYRKTADQATVDAAQNDAITLINSMIPAAASSINQLADKAFVNSSVATSTGTFKGTYNNQSDLPTTGVKTNDYAFVKEIDEQGNTRFNRYKYTSEGVWAFEYYLNNSSFTAAQWATIQSGFVAADKTKLDGIEEGAEVNPEAYLKSAAVADEKLTLTKQDDTTVEFSIADKADKVEDAVAGNFAGLDANGNLTDSGKKTADFVDATTQAAKDATQDARLSAIETQETAWNAKYNKPTDGIPKTDLAATVQTSLGLADTAVQPETGKGLSSNDYTDTEKTKLEGIETGAQVNPSAYLKNATVASDTLTITKQDDTTITFAGGAGKADKVTGATAGNFATLDSTGNLADSGKKPADFLTEHQSLAAYRTAAAQDAIHDSTKVDVVSGKGLSTNDYTTAEKTKLAGIEAGAQANPTAYLKNATVASDTLTITKQDDTTVTFTGGSATGKADKVASATAGNFAGLDATGNLTDSGKKPSDFLTEHQSLAAYRTSTEQDDIDAQYLPLSGGTMTGNIITGGNGVYGGDGKSLYLSGRSPIAADSDKGATLSLYNMSTYDGAFRLNARNNIEQSSLYGTAAGSLKWNDKELATQEHVSNTYLPLAGGTMTGKINMNGNLITGGGNLSFGLAAGSDGMYGADLGLNSLGNGGHFALTSRASGGGTVSLVGTPDGSLKWNSKELATQEFVEKRFPLNCVVENESTTTGWYKVFYWNKQGTSGYCAGNAQIVFTNGDGEGFTPSIYQFTWAKNAETLSWVRYTYVSGNPTDFFHRTNTLVVLTFNANEAECWVYCGTGQWQGMSISIISGQERLVQSATIPAKRFTMGDGTYCSKFVTLGTDMVYGGMSAADASALMEKEVTPAVLSVPLFSGENAEGGSY